MASGLGGGFRSPQKASKTYEIIYMYLRADRYVVELCRKNIAPKSEMLKNVPMNRIVQGGLRTLLPDKMEV